jgi:hypothetical protein
VVWRLLREHRMHMHFIDLGAVALRCVVAATLLAVVDGCNGDVASEGSGISPAGPSRSAQGQESQGQESQGQESQGQESQGQESQGQESQGQESQGQNGGSYWVHTYRPRPGATEANA